MNRTVEGSKELRAGLSRPRRRRPVNETAITVTVTVFAVRLWFG